jgi:hypothetical protein
VTARPDAIVLDRMRYLTRLAAYPSRRDLAFVELPPVVQFLYPAVKPIRIGLQRLRQP